MKYKCENELHTLNFKDFAISEIRMMDDKLLICTNGGVARYDNSCNETLEERYISECELQFIGYNIDKFILEGGKYFNADDVLIKEVPDTVIDKSEYADIFKKFKGEDSTIFFLSGKQDGDKYKIEFAVDVINDTYWVNISVDKLVIGFDRFMNRVMN